MYVYDIAYILDNLTSFSQICCVVFLFQQQFPESNVILITRPEQDTCEHMTPDDLVQQPLYDDSSGQVAFSQLEMETQVIINFNTEYFSDVYQQHSDLPEDSSLPALPSLVSNHT